MKISDTDLSPSEKTGRWFKYRNHLGDIVPGVELLIASLENEGYVLVTQTKMRGDANDVMRGRHRKKDILPSVKRQTEIEDDALARSVLLDWKGIENDDDDNPQDCTFENKLKALGRPRFREFVIECATDVAAFEEKELGNSPGSPASTSPGENSSPTGNQQNDSAG